MTDYTDLTAAAQAVVDPGTPAADLATIAQYQRSLWPQVALHPNAYPSLLSWMSARGDDAVRQAVAARQGAGSVRPAPAVAQPGAPSHSLPQESPAQQASAAHPSHAQQVPATAQPSHAQPVPVTAQPPRAQPVPATAQPSHAQPVPVTAQPSHAQPVPAAAQPPRQPLGVAQQAEPSQQMYGAPQPAIQGQPGARSQAQPPVYTQPDYGQQPSYIQEDQGQPDYAQQPDYGQPQESGEPQSYDSLVPAARKGVSRSVLVIILVSIVVLVGLVVGFIFFRHGLTSRPPASTTTHPTSTSSTTSGPGQTVGVYDLKPGDCVYKWQGSGSVDSAVVVDCTSPHQAEVFATGTDVANDRNTVQQYCLDRFAAYVGVQYTQSSLQVSFVHDGVSAATSNVTCLVYSETDTTVTSSFKGSGK